MGGGAGGISTEPIRTPSEFADEFKRTTIICVQLLNEPGHDKTNNTTCATSEDSDQPGHPPSLIRSLLCAQWVAKVPSFLQSGQ